jgi:hypothetical protein
VRTRTDTPAAPRHAEGRETLRQLTVVLWDPQPMWLRLYRAETDDLLRRGARQRLWWTLA